MCQVHFNGELDKLVCIIGSVKGITGPIILFGLLIFLIDNCWMALILAGSQGILDINIDILSSDFQSAISEIL